MITGTLLTGAIVVGGGAAAAAASAAGAYYYKKKKRNKKKKDAKKRKESTVFGQHLEDLEAISTDGLPLVVEACVEWLEIHGLDTKDLFSPNRSPIRAGELAKEFDKGEIPTMEREDPRDVGLLLTRYLSDLPEPLCTAVLFDEFVQLEVQSNNIEDWIEGMRNLLLQLPDINFRTIRRIVIFLWTLSKTWEENSNGQTPLADSAESLSKVFGRLVFDSWDSECAVASDGSNPRESLILKLIMNNSRVFAGVTTPVLSHIEKQARTITNVKGTFSAPQPVSHQMSVSEIFPEESEAEIAPTQATSSSSSKKTWRWKSKK